jgi:hypothetical protein
VNSKLPGTCSNVVYVPLYGIMNSDVSSRQEIVKKIGIKCRGRRKQYKCKVTFYY